MDTSTRTESVNLIDVLAGIEPGSELYDARRLRPEFVDGAEVCREAVLAPKNAFGLAHPVRVALAARMARRIGCPDLAATYEEMATEVKTDHLLTVIATMSDLPDDADAFTVALVRHTDLVTVRPRDNTRDDIEKLQNAGFSNPQIVALSELIAFVNFEARIIVGLSALDLVA
jgi:uncharacterized protein YciW